LDNQAKILEQQWKSFSEFLKTANEEENEKRKKKFWKKDNSWTKSVKWQLEGASGRKPNLEDVTAAVRGVEQKWKEKDRILGGKPQKLFRSFANSLQGHSNLLQMLPSQNQYLSIFCGALTTLIEVGALLLPFITVRGRIGLRPRYLSFSRHLQIINEYPRVLGKHWTKSVPRSIFVWRM